MPRHTRRYASGTGKGILLNRSLVRSITWVLVVRFVILLLVLIVGLIVYATRVFTPAEYWDCMRAAYLSGSDFPSSDVRCFPPNQATMDDTSFSERRAEWNVRLETWR